MRHFRYVLIAFMALIAPFCWAQDEPVLRGLTTIAVLVTAIPRSTQNDVRDCGLDASMLSTAAKSVIQQSNLKLVEANAAQARLLLLIKVYAIRSASQSLAACHVSVDANLTAPITGTTQWGSKVSRSWLWNSSDELIGAPMPTTLVQKATSDLVASVTKGFVRDWAKQN